MAGGDLPTHLTSPEFFLEPRTRNEQPFAVLSLDPHSRSRRITGVLTGVASNGTVVSGRVGTPQICVCNDDDREAVMRRIAAALRPVARHADTVTIYSWFPVGAFEQEGYRIEQQNGSAVLDLGGGAGAVFGRIKARRQIRHAIAAGVEVREALPADLPEYYSILKAWSLRKGLPCPEYSYLTDLLRLSASRRLLVAFHEGRMIAGSTIRFYPGQTVEYAWNASLDSDQSLRPNDLLQWRIIEWACGTGARTYLLGAIHPFLLKFSDRIMPSHRHFLDNTLFSRHILRDNLLRTLRRVRRSFAAAAGTREDLKH